MKEEHDRKVRVKAGGLRGQPDGGLADRGEGSSLAEMGLQPLLSKILLSLVSTANPLQVIWCLRPVLCGSVLVFTASSSSYGLLLHLPSFP